MTRMLGWMWLAVLALTLFYLFSTQGSLPGNLAVHFDLEGRPNGWMQKDAFLKSFIPMILLVNGIFGLLSAFIGRVPLESMNLPYKAQWISTPDRRAELYARLKGIPALTGVFINIVFLFAVQVVYQQNVPGAPFQIPLNGGVFMLLACSVLMVSSLFLLFRPPQ